MRYDSLRDRIALEDALHGLHDRRVAQRRLGAGRGDADPHRGSVDGRLPLNDEGGGGNREHRHERDQPRLALGEAEELTQWWAGFGQISLSRTTHEG